MGLKESLTLVQILTTAAVGVAAIYISHQQYKANRSKILFDLFHERYSVYVALSKLVMCALTGDNGIPKDVWNEYYAASGKAPFLFNKNISDYMLKIRKDVDSTVIYESGRSKDPKYDKMEDLGMYLDDMVEKFSPFLKVNIQEEITAAQCWSPFAKFFKKLFQ